jgi:hypothetical protein
MLVMAKCLQFYLGGVQFFMVKVTIFEKRYDPCPGQDSLQACECVTRKVRHVKSKSTRKVQNI